MDAVLKFIDVGKTFGKSAVLRKLDFQVEQGCFFGLAGVNGAGKTTLIKCMLGFCALDCGKIEIFGITHAESRSRERLAYLPERFSPPHYLKGADFLNFSLKLHGVAPDKSAMLSVLEDLDLECDALDKPVRAFSKGMAQKLGLASCFLSGKSFLVLDEPMSGLDPKARALVKMKLLESRSEGKTLLFTSHSLSDMSEICDRMMVLHEGRIRFCGTPDAFLGLSGESDIEKSFLNAIGKPCT